DKEVVVEGPVPDLEGDWPRRNQRLQITFFLLKAGGKDTVYARTCIRRIRGEREETKWDTGDHRAPYGRYVKTGRWKKFSQGGRVLTHRMLVRLLQGAKPAWW